jgi:hypothetical protein
MWNAVFRESVLFIGMGSVVVRCLPRKRLWRKFKDSSNEEVEFGMRNAECGKKKRIE